MNKEIFVYAGWTEEKPELIGVLYSFVIRGRETFSFEYENEWLESGVGAGSMLLDPDIQAFRGRQYLPGDKSIFGIFADSSPDRWGRLLMKRREAIYAAEEKRIPSRLTESDYLLGVYDDARMGGFRFSIEKGGAFLSDDDRLSTPPWVDLRKLEAIAMHIESNDDHLEKEWIDQLIAPGSSLGGARPKATIRDDKGELWIAKFPSKLDDYNIGAWEMVVHDLAKMCGLNVPEAKLISFTKNRGTFIVKRFDRRKNKRVHFASAMTMLGKTDMDNNAGYIDIAGFLKAHSVEPSKDLEELWKRMVFNMAVSNSDDHLRNHGFVLTKKGWILSPAYDINPVPYGNDLSLQIVPGDFRIDKETAIDSAHYYGLEYKKAKEMMEEIISTVRNNWERLSGKYSIDRQSMEYMKPAFMKL